MSKVGKWESGKVSALRQLTHYFLIYPILQLFYHTIFLKSKNSTRSSRTRTSKNIYDMLRLKLIWEFTIALVKTVNPVEFNSSIIVLASLS